MTGVTDVTDSSQAVLTVEGKSLKADLKGGGMSFDDFLEEADYAVIEDAYRRAGRAISPDLATSYSDYLARNEGDADDMETALIDAHVTIGALGLPPGSSSAASKTSVEPSLHPWGSRSSPESGDTRPDARRRGS